MQNLKGSLASGIQIKYYISGGYDFDIVGDLENFEIDETCT